MGKTEAISSSINLTTTLVVEEPGLLLRLWLLSLACLQGLGLSKTLDLSLFSTIISFFLQLSPHGHKYTPLFLVLQIRSKALALTSLSPHLLFSKEFLQEGF
jgi:hypothetical protein